MPSLGISGFGTQLKMEDAGNPGSYLTVAEVKDITGPGLTAEVADLTSHSSSGAFREKLPTLLDPGEVTFDVNYVPTSATHNNSTGLVSLLRTRAKKNWQLVWPDTGETLWAFAGFVTGFEPGAPVGDLLTASVTITVTGAPTLA